VNSEDRKAAGVEAFKKGEDFLSKKRMQEALECFDEAIDCGYVDNADVYAMRGSCLQSLDYDLDAIDDFDRAIVLQPENSLTFYQRSLSKTAAGDLRGCVSDLQAAIRLADVDNKYTRGLDVHARETGYKDSAHYYRLQMDSAKIRLDGFEGSMREKCPNRATLQERG
jgi:tetratricopeptide (TPR) repeat protein